MSDPVGTLSTATVIQALPPEAINTAVNSACRTIEAIIAPITATTSGVGLLIRTHFECLSEAKKASLALILDRTKRMLEASNAQLKKEPNPQVVVAALDAASITVDPDLREMWANLLAQEIIYGVHPQIPVILARMTSEDAKRLVRISKLRRPPILVENRYSGKAAKTLQPSYRYPSVTKESLSDSVLLSLGLARASEGQYSITELGKHFLKAVAPVTDAGA